MIKELGGGLVDVADDDACACHAEAKMSNQQKAAAGEGCGLINHT